MERKRCSLKSLAIDCFLNGYNIWVFFQAKERKKEKKHHGGILRGFFTRQFRR